MEVVNLFKRCPTSICSLTLVLIQPRTDRSGRCPRDEWSSLGDEENKTQRCQQIKHKKNQNQEIKHGRAAMLGFLHVIAIEAGVRLPGYLSVSQDLKFSDVPAGCFASLEAVPTAGWLQIMVLT